MRLPFIAANWKMNTTVAEAVALVKSMQEQLDEVKGVEKVICPPFISLTAVAKLVKNSSIGLGAQNMHFEDKGAYTGEVSPLMLSGLCQFVILGHSERREHFGESDVMINKKVQAALKAGLKPILCVGERLEENEAGKTIEVISRQIRADLQGMTSAGGLAVAYEPIWAIGTGRAASGEQANDTIGVIRKLIAEIYNDKAAQALRILYGGSVNSANIAEFISQPEIDGALVGGASLRAEEFISIVEQAARIKGSG
jgi:triosephosphate isomerase